MNTNQATFSVFPNDPGAGNYKLRGTVIGHDESPRPSRLALFREQIEVLNTTAPPGYEQVRAIRTDSNGQWEIKNLPPNKYTLIAYDKTGEFDPVIKGGLIPEPME